MTSDEMPTADPAHRSTNRDSRVDLVRGLALLVIFSDHIVGNPLREFMPISLGFSDMGEVFVFLSGYLNGVSQQRVEKRGQGPSHPSISGRFCKWPGASPRFSTASPAPPRAVRPFRAQLKRAFVRCVWIYGAMMLSQGLALAVSNEVGQATGYGLQATGYRLRTSQGLSLAVSNAVAVLGRSADSDTLPRMLAENPWTVAWNILTLRWLVWTYAVLALYLILIGSVPFVAAMLRQSLALTVLASGAVYVAVQVWPQSVALPQPWAGAFYFNPYAWQCLFVLGLACGAGGRATGCGGQRAGYGLRATGGRNRRSGGGLLTTHHSLSPKALIPRGALPLVAALGVLEAAFLVKSGWFPEVAGLPWFAESVDKVTLGPVRLLHFYAVLVAGRTLLGSWGATASDRRGSGGGTVRERRAEVCATAAADSLVEGFSGDQAVEEAAAACGATPPGPPLQRGGECDAPLLRGGVRQRAAGLIPAVCAQPLVVCGRHPLATYCVGGLLAIPGGWMLMRYGTGLGPALLVNIGGWAASIATAYAAALIPGHGRIARSEECGSAEQP